VFGSSFQDPLPSTQVQEAVLPSLEMTHRAGLGKRETAGLADPSLADEKGIIRLTAISGVLQPAIKPKAEDLEAPYISDYTGLEFYVEAEIWPSFSNEN
jgi:hypothetical protein